jgi:hypothetical protein
MKIAFFLLAHKNPSQVIRLIRALDGKTSSFYVHVDRRAPADVFDEIARWAQTRPNVHFTERQVCRWGQFGIVAASLSCVRCALRCNDAFEFALLLSGQDYPLKPLKFLQSFLADRADKQFIESFRLDKPNRWTAMSGAYQSMNKVLWLSLAIRSRRIHIPFKRRFPPGLEPHGGSQWWCLSRECLVYIDAFLEKNQSVIRYFRHVFIPDESFFQTIVSSARFARNVENDDLHFIDWDRPNPAYPRTFEYTDLEMLRDSGKFFARKFDMARDERILDLIDENLLMLDQGSSGPK